MSFALVAAIHVAANLASVKPTTTKSQKVLTPFEQDVMSRATKDLESDGDEHSPICDENTYPRVPQGRYQARCTAVKLYRDPRFGWKIRLEFFLISNFTYVYGFYNGGHKDHPRFGRGSRYRRDWSMVNGGPPKKRQRLTPRIFLDKIFEVQVGDTRRTFDGKKHFEGDVYSTVKAIIWPEN
jgi:hypothetical protein